MKKSELKELYQMMFPDYPDIVTVKQLRDKLHYRGEQTVCTPNRLQTVNLVRKYPKTSTVKIKQMKGKLI